MDPMFWVDPATGELKEADEDTAQRYGLRPATDDDFAAFHEARDNAAADTKGTFGLIAEGAQRGLGHLVDAAGAVGFQPPMPGSDGFGPGAGMPMPLPAGAAPDPSAPTPTGAEAFPEAFSEEARRRTEMHPIATGIGTGLPFAPLAGLAGAGAAATGLGMLGAGAAAGAASTVVEAAAQEYDDAWLERRPFELKNVANYTAMFGLGGILLGAGTRTLGRALSGAAGAASRTAGRASSAVLGQNIVSEAQAKAAARTGTRATGSVGAASARELSEPFDDAIATMSEPDAVVLARDATDRRYIIAQHSSDDIERIYKGLTDSLGNQIKYEDARIHLDAIDEKTIARQVQWTDQAVDALHETAAELQMGGRHGLDYGPAGKRLASELEEHARRIAEAQTPFDRFHLTDNAKKRLDKAVMQIADDWRADPHVQASLFETLEPLVGIQNKKGGLLRQGLENTRYWGGLGDLQRSLNAPWHDMLQSWTTFQREFLEATGQKEFGMLGAGRVVKESPIERVLSVISKDPRSLGRLQKHVANVFDGYQRLIEARQAHGITHLEGLPQLEQSIRNLMEDWNLAATVSTAVNKAEHVAKNPRGLAKILKAAEGTPLVGGWLGAARRAGEALGDPVDLKKGTPLGDVWDAALGRYARHPGLQDASIYAQYSPWMQDALRARGAPIPPSGVAPSAWAGAAKEAAGRVAGAGLFGLGVQQASQRPATDDQGQPVRGADLGAGAIAVGLAMALGGPGALRRFGLRAARRADRFVKPARGVIDEAIEGWSGHSGLARWAKAAEDPGAVERAVEAAARDIANKALEHPIAKESAQEGYHLGSDFEHYARERIMERLAREAGDARKPAPSKLRPHVARALKADRPPPARHPLGAVWNNERIDEVRDGLWELGRQMREAEANRMIPDGLPADENNRLVDALDDRIADINGAIRKATAPFSEKLAAVKDPAEAERLLARAQAAAEQAVTSVYGRDLPHEVRRFTEVAADGELMNAAWRLINKHEERTGTYRRLRGAGMRVRSLEGIDDEWAARVRVALAKKDAKQLARLKESVERRLGAEDAGLPEDARGAVARELVQAAIDREPIADAIADIARTVDANSASVPLHLQNYHDLVHSFDSWARSAEGAADVDIMGAIDSYVGNLDYHDINLFARDGVEALAAKHPEWPDRVTEIGGKARDLQAALDYAAEQGMTAPGRTWRGIRVSPEELGALERAADEGGIVEAYGFMSTSANSQYPRQFISKRHKEVDGRIPVVIEVDQRTAVPVNPAEAEVLMRAGSKFKLERVSDPHSGASFRATELEGESTSPLELAKGARKAYPWIAGGVLGVGATLDPARASAAPELREPNPTPDDGGPAGLYRGAVRDIAKGGEATIRDRASSALRFRPPKGRSPLRAFVGGSRRSLDAAVDQAREAINQLAADPAALIDTIAGGTGELARTHPAVYAALVEKAVGIVTYLAPHVPPRSGQTLLDPEGMPPSTDRSLAFAYRVVGATNPEQAMGDIARGFIPPEELEAFQANWPEQFEQFRAEVVGQVKRRYEAGRPLDTEKLRALDGNLALDGALDPSASVAVAMHILSAADAAAAAPAQNTAPSQTPHALSGRASGMFRTRLAAASKEKAIG